MADERLTELRGLHMPPIDLAATVAETFAGLAIGLLLAWALVHVIMLLTRRRIPPERVALARLADAPDLSARAAILQDYARSLDGEGDWLTRVDAHLDGLFSTGAGVGMRDSLYRPGATFDLEAFDAALMARLERAGR